MKKLLFVVKRICLGIFALYSVNVLFSAINVVIPINIYSISISCFLGIFGIVALILLKFLI